MTLRELIKDAKREGYQLNIDNIKEEKVGRSYKYYDSRNKEVDGMHYVYTIARGRKQWFICCPFCNHIHIHGIGEGHRLSQCKGMKQEIYCID